MATPVVSLPVPAMAVVIQLAIDLPVVGIAMRGLIGPGGGSPFPIGGFTY